MSIDGKWHLKRGGLVHVTNHSGHRGSYQDLFCKLLALRPSTGSAWRKIHSLVIAPHVLFATLDGEEFAYATIGLVRAMLGRSTVGLFLRPQGCFKKTAKGAVKGRLFRLLKRVKAVHTLTILPFEIDQRYAEVADNWIYDPQLWDLSVDGLPLLPETDLSRRVEALRDGRKVMIFIGGANLRKGFDGFVAQAEAQSESLLCVSAGQVSPECKRHAERLVALGMIVEDRFVTDNELLSLYKVADLAWCCYAPEYDQSSGVFGRAVQSRCGAIIRNGSQLEIFVYKFGLKKASNIEIQDRSDKKSSIVPSSDSTIFIRSIFLESIEKIHFLI